MKTKKLTALISSLMLAIGAVPANTYAENVEINPADWDNNGVINCIDGYYCISYINYFENAPTYEEDLGISIDKYIKSEESIAETNKNHDMNGDGVIDKYDFIMLSQLINDFKYHTSDGDVNHDCRTDIVDGYMIKYFIENPECYTKAWAENINIYGDINEDGVVDMADADYILSGEYSKSINSNVQQVEYTLTDGTVIHSGEEFSSYLDSYINSDSNLGDVNHDGLIDSVDVTMILEYFANMATGKSNVYTEEELENFQKYGDVLNDGVVNPIDASWVLSKYAELATQ